MKITLYCDWCGHTEIHTVKSSGFSGDKGSHFSYQDIILKSLVSDTNLAFDSLYGNILCPACKKKYDYMKVKFNEWVESHSTSKSQF